MVWIFLDVFPKLQKSPVIAWGSSTIYVNNMMYYTGELSGETANSADDVREDDVKASSPPATAASPVINFSIDGAHVQKNPGRPSK